MIGHNALPYKREVKMLPKKRKSQNLGQKSNEMNAMDQGANLVAQTINQMTGLDKGNDGKKSSP